MLSLLVRGAWRQWIKEVLQDHDVILLPHFRPSEWMQSKVMNAHNRRVLAALALSTYVPCTTHTAE